MRISDWSSDVCSSELQWAVLAAGLAATLVLLRLDGGTGASIAFAPLRQGDMLLRWLSGPFVYAAWPLLDPQIASQLPVAAARVPAQAVAQAYEGAFGSVLLARWRSEEHTSELQSLMRISYAVFCLKKKNTYKTISTTQ